jgi:Eukaryotic initiation factor 4E
VDDQTEEGVSHALLGAVGVLSLASTTPVVLSLRRPTVVRFLWLQLLALVGGEFEMTSELCGVALSVRHHEDHLSLWHRTADNRAAADHMQYVPSIVNIPAIVCSDGSGAVFSCQRCVESRHFHTRTRVRVQASRQQGVQRPFKEGQRRCW